MRVANDLPVLSCEAVTNLLTLRDIDARVERAPLLSHFLSCPACSRAHPEARLLLARRPVDDLVALRPDLPRFHVARTVRVASLFMVVVSLIALTRTDGASPSPANPSRTSSPVEPPSAGARSVPSGDATAQNSRVVLDRGRRTESVLTRGEAATATPVRRRSMNWESP